jgi:hypothetical protein
MKIRSRLQPLDFGHDAGLKLAFSRAPLGTRLTQSR